MYQQDPSQDWRVVHNQQLKLDNSQIHHNEDDIGCIRSFDDALSKA